MDNEDLNSVPIVPMKLPKRFDQLDEWTTSMFLFESALKEINTKIEKAIYIARTKGKECQRDGKL